jgi:hypothetical protein
MASTFSNLGLNLQATGENSGTWGELTNVNLQEIDNAISGVVTITLTGNTTLAFTSNATSTTFTDEAGRNKTIILSGSLSATTVTVSVPNIEKDYVIINNSGGTAIISSGGSTTVTVKTGSKNYVIVNPATTSVIAAIPDTTPGGTDKQIQFNNNGSFGGITMGTTGQVLTTDGTTASFGDISGGAAWQAVQTADFNVSAKEGYFVDTTSTTITATLPASPTLGDFVSFIDYAGTFDTNNLTIARNGKPIQGSATDLTVATERAGLTLVFTDNTQGWLLQNN